VEAKSIKVKDAVIGGKVVGILEASNRVYLESKSVFLGDVQAKLLVIEEGATFKGKCNAGKDTEDIQRLEGSLQGPVKAKE
jgi:cytoskeletal protein CcmA (bactofilin family)